MGSYIVLYMSHMGLPYTLTQLKRALGDQLLVPQLPQGNVSLQVPSQILQHRTIERGEESVEQVKVLWSRTDASLSTWEDAAALHSRFPAAPAWGQASAQVWGNVRIQNQQGGMTTQEGGGERRSARKKYLNSKVFGPQWVV